MIFGWNQGQKDGINMGRVNNQSFVVIPTGKLKDRIEQLCDEHGIRFIEQEESYTSKASFLSADVIPTYGEKPKREYKFSGKRIKRGSYIPSNKKRVNSDCNGSANIMRKASIQLDLNINLTEVCRGVLTLPHRVNIFKIKYDLNPLASARG